MSMASRLFMKVGIITACFISPSALWAQVTLVCQTPGFWCGIPAPDYFDRQPCWCNTAWGPVNGFTIIPFASGVPPPAPRSERTPPAEEVVIDPAGEECLNGLGNCEGAFSSWQ